MKRIAWASAALAVATACFGLNPVFANSLEIANIGDHLVATEVKGALPARPSPAL